jgi:hypothetical protein
MLGLLYLVAAQSCDVSSSQKVDCGYAGINQAQCESTGCCWATGSPGSVEPWCFHKTDASPTCFNLLPANFDEAPFDDASIQRMAKYFLANLNVDGTGAVIASPGAVPALPSSCPGGYHFHWMRDGALSIKALMETANITNISTSTIQRVVQSYVKWVTTVTAGSAEPKWNISAAAPYAYGSASSDRTLAHHALTLCSLPVFATPLAATPLAQLVPAADRRAATPRTLAHLCYEPLRDD